VIRESGSRKERTRLLNFDEVHGVGICKSKGLWGAGESQGGNLKTLREQISGERVTQKSLNYGNFGRQRGGPTWRVRENQKGKYSEVSWGEVKKASGKVAGFLAKVQMTGGPVGFRAEREENTYQARDELF